MEIRQDRHEDVAVVTPSGRVDTTTSGELEKHLLDVLQAGEKKLVVDMSGVEYISSAGLRVLLLATKKSQQAGGRLVLCAMRESVRQIFDLAGFLTIFAVEPALEAALARVRAS